MHFIVKFKCAIIFTISDMVCVRAKVFGHVCLIVFNKARKTYSLIQQKRTPACSCPFTVLYLVHTRVAWHYNMWCYL